ncbi:outer membrane receptor protein [Herbaspirillum sp. YR522]|nr:outer membrane receptor protein [Herbaspirillum sp. YR522]
MLLTVCCITAAADVARPLPGMTVSASRFVDDAAFVPVAATVVDAGQIRDAGIDNANDAIRRLGGVRGRQSLAGPGDFALDLRGFGGNGDRNMVVLLDGVRISENELSSPLLSSIPIASIERIEIVRGGSSVLYGGGATGGTIQIVTRQPQANATRAFVAAEIGSDGRRGGRAFVARGWDGLAIDASVDRTRDGGYRHDSRSVQQNASSAIQWSGADWRFGLRLNLARADYALPGALTLAQFNADPRQSTQPGSGGSYDNDTVTIFMQRRVADIEMAAELSQRDKIARGLYVGRFGVSSVDSHVRQVQFSPRLRHLVQAGAVKHRLAAGVDLSDWRNAAQASYGNSDAQQRSRALYLRDEVEWAGNARIALGVRRELYSQRSASGRFDRGGGIDAWDLQASHAPWSRLRVFAKLGQSYRLATPDETGATNLPAGQVLKPQRSHDLELGAVAGSGERTVTARWFRHRVRDEISYDPTLNLGFGANTNLDPTQHHGVELEARWRATASTTLSAAYQHVTARFVGGTHHGRELALVPANSLSARFQWRAGRHGVGGGVRWVDRQRVGNDFTNRCRKMPSIVTVDARYALRVRSWELALAGDNLGGRNVFSQAYACDGGQASGIYPENGRTVKLTIRHDF